MGLNHLNIDIFLLLLPLLYLVCLILFSPQGHTAGPQASAKKNELCSAMGPWVPSIHLA